MTIKEYFHAILKISSDNRYPDIHLVTGKKPYIRYENWDLAPVDSIDMNWETIQVSPLKPEEMKAIILLIDWESWLAKFEEEFELDTSYDYEGIDRYRINCYYDKAWACIALRIIPTKIPTLEDLWLWESIKEICKKNKGLILVTWPTWSWKSTNLAAMIDYINRNYKKHIITIEDPVEFSFESKECLINQREVWNHTKSFPRAIRAALREDPDIIMVWEMRDPETIQAALTLAETGHLVLSTLHTNDTVQSVDRIIDVFPSWQQDQIRMQLALSLVAIISQRLLPKTDNTWRVAARELLLNNDAVKNLIISWKSHQLYSVLEVSGNEGMMLMDKYLTKLFQRELITKETLMSYARDKDMIGMSI